MQNIDKSNPTQSSVLIESNALKANSLESNHSKRAITLSLSLSLSLS